MTTRGWVLAAVFSLGAASMTDGAAHAQTNVTDDSASRPSSTAPKFGQTGAVPVPRFRERDQEKFEIPELAGAIPAKGSQLVDGRLPKPRIDYFSKAGTTTQRITLFEGGLVSIRISEGRRYLQKKLRLPPDAAAVYEKFVGPSELSQVPEQFMDAVATSDRAFLRVYDSRGGVVERRFNPTATLGSSLERQVHIMEDLLRALAEDREMTSALSEYTPTIGDQLVGEDENVYEITQLYNDGKVLELTNIRQPFKMFVEAKEIHTFFVARRERSGVNGRK